MTHSNKLAFKRYGTAILWEYAASMVLIWQQLVVVGLALCLLGMLWLTVDEHRPVAPVQTLFVAFVLVGAVTAPTVFHLLFLSVGTCIIAVGVTLAFEFVYDEYKHIRTLQRMRRIGQHDTSLTHRWHH